MMQKLPLVFIFFVLTAFPQSKDPDLILKEVKENFNRIETYIVDIHVKVDVNFLDVPETDAKIYFEAPDKVHLESEDFAILPKEGLNLSPASILSKKYTAIFVGYESLNKNKTTVIKVIPLSDNSDVILTTLWIDESKNIIRKVESSTRIGGTYSIILNYDNPRLDFPLPSSMIFVLNSDNADKQKPDSKSNQNKSNKEDKRSAAGKVYVTYKNYKVNVDIPDEIFNQKEEN